MIIQDATAADLPAILAIYNDAVQHTTAIWNETLVDLANRQAWLNERNAAGFPVLVAHNDAGDVVGYASYGTWRAIEGFRHTVEHSVYVRSDQRGQGLGPVLLQALIERAQAASLHVMVAPSRAATAPQSACTSALASSPADRCHKSDANSAAGWTSPLCN